MAMSFGLSGQLSLGRIGAAGSTSGPVGRSCNEVLAPRRGLAGLADKLLGRDRQSGYYIDSNRDGKYQRGQEEVLAFDFNGDGKLGRDEVTLSREVLLSLGGHIDLNRDGRVTRSELQRSQMLKKQFQGLDQNQDGKLDSQELVRAKARLWADRNRDGEIQSGEIRGTGRVQLNYRNSQVDYLG